MLSFEWDTCVILGNVGNAATYLEFAEIITIIGIKSKKRLIAKFQ